MQPNRKRRAAIFAILFILSVGNFSRIQGNDNIRTIQFLSIFAMGMLFGLLVKEIAESIRDKQQQ